MVCYVSGIANGFVMMGRWKSRPLRRYIAKETLHGRKYIEERKKKKIEKRL